MYKKICKWEIIKGIFFEVMFGEVFGFFGLNGVGKIMMIWMIVGLIKLIFGMILIGGKDIWKNFIEVMCGFGLIVENLEFYIFLMG